MRSLVYRVVCGSSLGFGIGLSLKRHLYLGPGGLSVPRRLGIPGKAYKLIFLSANLFSLLRGLATFPVELH